MNFSLTSLATYAKVAVTSCCSSAGICLVTHNKLQGSKSAVLIQKIASDLETKLKRSVYLQATSCLDAEIKKLDKVAQGLKGQVRYGQNKELKGYDTSEYSDCQIEVSYGDTVEKLFLDSENK